MPCRLSMPWRVWVANSMPLPTRKTPPSSAAISKEHLSRAVELLTDIVFHSQYPQQAMDKQLEAICDEIESYNDSPIELIYDEFENLLFEGHPSAINILGYS